MSDTVTAFRLLIPGEPVGKARPRVTQHGTFTPQKTRRAEGDVKAIWREAGCPRLPDGPVVFHARMYMPRPQSHFTSRGALSAVGRRTPYPTRKPDWDNAGKLLADALCGLAFRDDADVVDGHVYKRWCGAENPVPCTILTLLVKGIEAQTRDTDEGVPVAFQTLGGVLEDDYPARAAANGGVNHA